MPFPALKPRFSLRAMLVLMTALACFLWYHISWINQRRAAIEDQLVFPITYPGDVEQEAPGLLWMFGEEGHHQMLVNGLDDGAEANCMRAIFPEAICSGRAEQSSSPQATDPLLDTIIINSDLGEAL